MVAKRIRSGPIGYAPGPARLLVETDAGDLGIREHDFRQQPVVHLPRTIGVRDVVRRDLALLDGDMDDIVRADDISNRKNVALGRSHLRIHHHPPIARGDAGGVQVHAVDIGPPAQRLEDLFRGSAGVPAFMDEVGRFETVRPAESSELRPAEECDSFTTKLGLQGFSDVVIVVRWCNDPKAVIDRILGTLTA